MSITTDYANIVGMNATTAVGKADKIEEISTADDFIAMLVAEIQNQDPLEPMDNAEYIAQLTQFQTLDAVNALRDDIQDMTSINMIGKEVATTLGDGTTIKGVVQSIYKENGVVMLDLGDYAVKFEDVVAIQEKTENDDIYNDILNELKNITNAININEENEKNKENEGSEGDQTC